MDQRHFEQIRLGDQVRLTDDQESGGGWTVVGRSFGSMTLDLAGADPNSTGRMLRGVRAATVLRVGPPLEREARGRDVASASD